MRSAIRRHGVRWAAVLAVLALAACHSTGRTSPTGAQPKAPPPSATAAPAIKPAAALFYTKAGSLYVSEPAGTPGRKLTDGPIDTQPAPSPDLSHVAFVRKTAASQYGGELWIVDLSPQLAPAGPPRRLVSPAALPRGTGDSAPMVVSPRWSPTGQHVAFVDNEDAGMVDGGILLVVASDTGAVLPQKQPLLAESSFVWAPDGSHIAWVDARSDVSPVDINALAVGGASTPVATDTNAYSVTYGKNGQTILFTNGNASGPDFAAIPFAVRTGGIYSVSASTEPGANPPSPLRYSPSRVPTTATSRPWNPGPSPSPRRAPTRRRRRSRSSTRVRLSRARRPPTSRLPSRGRHGVPATPSHTSALPPKRLC